MAAGAPKGGLGGQEMEVALIVMDGLRTGKADPAFAAHMDVALHWAQAIWNHWLPVQALQLSVDHARERISSTSRPWAVVAGPAAALICTLERVGWSVISATELESDDGRVFHLAVDHPVVIKRAVEAAVRRWRWRNLAEKHPSLHKVGCSFAPILKLLSSKQNDDERTPPPTGYAAVRRRKPPVPSSQMPPGGMGPAPQVYLLPRS